jgi:hypothetical protein
MRRAWTPIGEVFVWSQPGLKTRFEQLLVAADRATLERRMRAFFEAADEAGFTAAWPLPASCGAKLTALFSARAATRFDPARIRPFARVAGRPHRFKIPASAMAFAYVDPALIPRGDHRFLGRFDPHQAGPKLVFNVREVPLYASVLEGPVCVHDYRHSRFAALHVPEALVRGELRRLRASPGPADTLNLRPRWATAARLFQQPGDLLHYVAGVVNSRVVQEDFAPWVGATEEVPIPVLDERNAPLARCVAEAARGLGPGADLPEQAERAVRSLYDAGRGERPGRPPARTHEPAVRSAPRPQRLL